MTNVSQLNKKKKKKKLESYTEKNEIKSFPNSIYKNKFKMDLKPKSKTKNHKTPGGKFRQNAL